MLLPEEIKTRAAGVFFDIVNQKTELSWRSAFLLFSKQVCFLHNFFKIIQIKYFFSILHHYSLFPP